jgi:hypothetical protein
VSPPAVDVEGDKIKMIFSGNEIKNAIEFEA